MTVRIEAMLLCAGAATYRVDRFWPKPLPHKWIMHGGRR